MTTIIDIRSRLDGFYVVCTGKAGLQRSLETEDSEEATFSA